MSSTKLRRLAIASALAAGVAACGERCPECPATPLPSGAFAGPARPTYQWGTSPAPPSVQGEPPKSMDVDVAAGRVTVRYQRAGVEVVETWRIASLTQCPDR
jgi:hypothetical protein